MRTAVLLAVLLPATASASTAAERARIELLRRSAERAVEAQDFAKAIALYGEIDQLAPDPQNLLDIALTYDRWGDRCEQALAIFERLLAECTTCPLLDRVRTEHLLVQNRCAGEIEIATDPPGAVVVIDGDHWARIAPFTLPLRPGPHTIDVRSFGHTTKRETLDVRPKTNARVFVTLEPEAPPPAPAPPAPIVERAPSTLALAAAGTGVAAGIAGAVFTALAIADVDAEREARSAPEVDPAHVEDLRNSARLEASLAYAGFGLAIAGFLAGAALHLLEPEAPNITADGGSTGLTWSF